MENTIKKVKVNNLESNKGNTIPNQFEIWTPDGTYFQSYSSIICFRPLKAGEKTVLDSSKWDYSTTTGKYRNIFLNEKKKETQSKIDNGTYLLADLND